MAKGKGKEKGNGGVQHRAIYSRVSFLQQAAVLLSTATEREIASEQPSTVNPNLTHPLQGLGRQLVTDLRSVSLKTRIRLSPAVKQTICKYCDSVLIEGETCTSTVENRSKGGRKPWADVLVRKCHGCGRERRYPVNAPRPKRKTERGEAVKPDNELEGTTKMNEDLRAYHREWMGPDPKLVLSRIYKHIECHG
ncbi:RNAse P Rpr2/Rpp21/SNM1 subunit domain-containing protein [Rhypophila decipiens]|uniref:RNAse P Rpr2/Rpp21/SNM1 subunit domain-containing protein n=1 Tax=Rhypophila decipiens TaxID=261697 RepID=A0AAN6Y7V1_9PEZI|nr:RNAse P Rpr2/Rpp21/SNM1 subunit domain-containing protein [Rhypophila decipiens]